IDFWNNARRELDAIKPVFMLAEWEARDLHAKAFDMTYAWTWFQAVLAIAQGKSDLSELLVYYAWNEKAYPHDGLRMLFVSNHDINTWEGTEFELFGPARQAAIVLSFVSEGFPLIYNGQEAGNPRRLAFFERDPLEWQDHPQGELYRRLIALKKANPALWNGAWGGRMLRVDNSAPNQVLSFLRQQGDNRIFAVFNFSDQPQTACFGAGPQQGRYVEYFSSQPGKFGNHTELDLQPWEYRVYRATG
ncbi:MAG: alpha amylase C-terminal domain-containing protein, partial [Anaerolineales bacterium]|nr:alpha amylase C-terminal domain-containing protein [Anaerolineales bacterium]